MVNLMLHLVIGEPIFSPYSDMQFQGDDEEQEVFEQNGGQQLASIAIPIHPSRFMAEVSAIVKEFGEHLNQVKERRNSTEWFEPHWYMSDAALKERKREYQAYVTAVKAAREGLNDDLISATYRRIRRRHYYRFLKTFHDRIWKLIDDYDGGAYDLQPGGCVRLSPEQQREAQQAQLVAEKRQAVERAQRAEKVQGIAEAESKKKDVVIADQRRKIGSWLLLVLYIF